MGEENEKSTMRSMILDKVRNWYTTEYEANGKLPDLPESGLDFLFKQPDNNNSESQQPPQTAPATDPSSEDGKYHMTPSKFYQEIEAQMKTYLDWDIFVAQQKELDLKRNDITHTDVQIEETVNYMQTFEKTVIRNKIRDDIEQKTREEIHTLVELEMDALRSILDKKGKGKKKGKKDKKKGKKGKKGEKDLTANRTMDSLVEELVDNGIMTVPLNVTSKHMVSSYRTVTKITTHDGELHLLPSLFNLRDSLCLFVNMPLHDTQ